MERDNGAIELQFVGKSHQWGITAKPDIPLKSSRSVCESGTSPVHCHCWNVCHCLLATTAGVVGAGEGDIGYTWFVVSKIFRMVSGILWIMSVRHKLLWLFFFFFNYWKHPFRMRKRKTSGIYRSAECGPLVLQFIPQKETIGGTSGFLLSHRINFCHIIKTLTAVGSPTIPPTKSTELLTNPQWWILTSSQLSLNHLDSMDSDYTDCWDSDCTLSTHVTNRCCKSFDYFFMIIVFCSYVATVIQMVCVCCVWAKSWH